MDVNGKKKSKKITKDGTEDGKTAGNETVSKIRNSKKVYIMKKAEAEFNKYRGALFGLVVGDALGVPAEFQTRAELKTAPVTGMTGYGTHNQPPGTWSDDSSMVLATLEWLGEMKNQRPDYNLLMEKFSRWLLEGCYTPYGDTFDCGISTSRAIINYGKGMKPLQCGGKTEWENGNGSLMRILPAALWKSEELAAPDLGGKDFIYNVSSLTHDHLRSRMGCLIYSKLIADLFYNSCQSKLETVTMSLLTCKRYFDSIDDENMAYEKSKYARLWDIPAFQKLDEASVKSSGYVVDTLEAAIWCFLNTDSYRDCVLMAVNLGEDTDTVGAIAGGLAGLYYGIDAVPEEWISKLRGRKWIEELISKMVDKKEIRGRSKSMK